jgi:hypothetical protein
VVLDVKETRVAPRSRTLVSRPCRSGSSARSGVGGGGLDRGRHHRLVSAAVWISLFALFVSIFAAAWTVYAWRTAGPRL